MFSFIRQWTDQFLGRGDAAITIPVMDGALKQNRDLDEAQVVGKLDKLEDLVSTSAGLLAAAGPDLFIHHQGQWDLLKTFDQPITAMACLTGTQGQSQKLAVALGGREVKVFELPHKPLNAQDPWTAVATLDAVVGKGLTSINALAFGDEGQLFLTDGSREVGYADWCRDLMSLGKTGRLIQWHYATGQSRVLKDKRRYAFGVLVRGDKLLFSESWAHRLVDKDGKNVVDSLVGYPSRLSPASDGGFWLTCFVCRSQLVEFVLREKAYRTRMLAEIDPRYWIAPMLSSGKDFLEPLQGAGVKSMGVLKPWAPPRSYGLVMKFSPSGQLVSSMHSLVDGRFHGITSAVEHQGSLFVASKGSGHVLKVVLTTPGVAQ